LKEKYHVFLNQKKKVQSRKDYSKKKPETKPGKNAAFENGGWLFNNKDPMLIVSAGKLGEPDVKVPNELETPGFDIVSKNFFCQFV